MREREYPFITVTIDQYPRLQLQGSISWESIFIVAKGYLAYTTLVPSAVLLAPNQYFPLPRPTTVTKKSTITKIETAKATTIQTLSFIEEILETIESLVVIFSFVESTLPIGRGMPVNVSKLLFWNPVLPVFTSILRLECTGLPLPWCWTLLVTSIRRSLCPKWHTRNHPGKSRCGSTRYRF